MDDEGIYQKGFELRCNGQYGEAKAEFQKVLSINPAHLKARLQMALIMGFEGDFDRSLSMLESLSSQFPKDDEVVYELAMTQFMLGMNDEACGNLKVILARNPGHEKALQQSAYC